ncbi:Protein of unknown function, partial [Gryllus bimaculatus]
MTQSNFHVTCGHSSWEIFSTYCQHRRQMIITRCRRGTGRRRRSTAAARSPGAGRPWRRARRRTRRRGWRACTRPGGRTRWAASTGPRSARPRTPARRRSRCCRRTPGARTPPAHAHALQGMLYSFT